MVPGEDDVKCPRPGHEAVLTDIPNLLTLSRILAIPALCAAFYLPGVWADWAPLGLFIAAGITDWADGHFARRYRQQSELGRFLDPVADKLLVAAVILMLVAFDRVAGWSVLAAAVILCREILVAGLREFLAELRVKVPVTRMAKWKTTVQMVALGFLLAYDSAPAWTHAPAIGIAGLWFAALLTLYTGYDYLRAGLRHMTQPAPQQAERDAAARRTAKDMANANEPVG
jgi:cardiolipin synthase (CMP-forming)